jgi:hypothetical protein
MEAASYSGSLICFLNSSAARSGVLSSPAISGQKMSDNHPDADERADEGSNGYFTHSVK